jgi:hypothetical protein
VPVGPEAEPAAPSEPPPEEEKPALPVRPKEYRPIMLAPADEAFDSEGLYIEVDTSLLPTEELRFELDPFISRAFAYASEGYESIQIKPEDAEEWGVWAVVAANR